MSQSLNLFDNADRDDFGDAGGGLLSQNALSGGNSGMLGLIGEQIRSRRKEHASGDLYNAFHEAEADAHTRLGNLSAADNARRMGTAGIANQRYTSYLNRPRKPSLWEKILGGVEAVAPFAAMAI